MAFSNSTTIALPSRGVISLSGPDARSFLQGIITNDVNKVSDERAIYAALLTPQGKYLHDFIIAASGDTLYLDCEADRRSDLVRRLMMYRLRAKADIKDETDTLGVIAMHDDNVPDSLITYRDPRHESLGNRAILPRADMPAGTDKDYDQLRLELGIPDASRDFQVEKTLILEGNMEELNGVDFAKGCYVGQELTARMKHRGKVRKRLLPVEITGALPAPDSPIMNGTKEIGLMRSGLGNRGMALIRLDDITPDTTCLCEGSSVKVIIPEYLDHLVAAS